MLSWVGTSVKADRVSYTRNTPDNVESLIRHFDFVVGTYSATADCVEMEADGFELVYSQAKSALWGE